MLRSYLKKRCKRFPSRCFGIKKTDRGRVFSPDDHDPAVGQWSNGLTRLKNAFAGGPRDRAIERPHVLRQAGLIDTPPAGLIEQAAFPAILRHDSNAIDNFR